MSTEYELQQPSDWRKVRESIRYSSATSMVYDIDSAVSTWQDYFYYAKRRAAPTRKKMVEELAEEYRIEANRLIKEAHQMITWNALSR